jgi:putative spermidine/putrescine transport system ATP-binding protein
MFTLGRAGQLGKARIDALESTYAVGDEVIAWWRPERQRIVAA